MVSSEDQQQISPFTRKFDLNNGQAFEKATKIGLRSEDYVPGRVVKRAKSNGIH